MNNTKDIKIEMKSHADINWRETTLENFLLNIEVTRDIITDLKIADRNADDYTQERALWSLRTGGVIDTPMFVYRLAEGVTCPLCGAKFQDGVGALSRKDNKTNICSDCGTREAMECLRLNNTETTVRI